MAKVALINPAGVDTNAIAEVCEAAELPEGEVRLIVGDPQLDDNYQGVTIARAFVHLAGNIYGLRDYLRERWDCGVILGRTWAERQEEFPAYFAYLLAHEFGHTTTVLSNIGLTIYEDLILRYIGRTSGGKRWRWDEMPHEIAYDQFGIAVAEELLGRSRVEAEFSSIIARGLSSDVPRLENALRLTPTKDLGSLRQALVAFSLPYRDEFLRLWREDQERGVLRIASGLTALDALWDAS